MDEDATEEAWFEGLASGDVDGGARAVRQGRAAGPRDWPALAVAAGFAADRPAYYGALHEATVAAARAEAAERERATDQQVVHAVRALDDCERTANELAERVTEWAGSRYEDVPAGVDGARAVVAGEVGPETGEAARSGTGASPVDERLRSLADRVRDLDDEADSLRAFLERTMPGLAPNLSALAGPILAARLVALAGGLEDLAKLPSGTVQVLGAEDALFAHLQGGAPSPKHGVIYTHEAIRNTRPADRGSAARALAGKLTIAARIDHYSGDRRPDLEAEFTDRIDRIRGRAGSADQGETETDETEETEETDEKDDTENGMEGDR